MRAKLATVARDALALAGLAAVAYGAGLVYYPAGWVVGGALAVLVALAVDREGPR